MGTISLHLQDRRGELVIDRPPLNILDLATLGELDEALVQVAARADVQLLVVRGAGGRAFSAGVAVEDHTPEKVGDMLERFHRALERLRTLDAVAVAAVDGHCLGGGLELAAACDLGVATRTSRFGQPEIQLACYPPYAAALYPARLGHGRTLDLLVTGRVIEAEEAERLGLVHRLAEPGRLDAAVEELAESILAHSAPVVRLAKRAVRAAGERPLAEALAESERLYLEELTRVEDMEEGIRAFLEKRPPEWKHR